MYALNFYSPLVADQLRSGRKSATIRLGDKSGKYKKGMVVRVLCGVRFSPREHVFDAVIDKVEVKTLGALSPREIEHDNPEIRRTDEMANFLGQLYNREVGADDLITVIRFSQIMTGPVVPGFREDACEIVGMFGRPLGEPSGFEKARERGVGRFLRLRDVGFIERVQAEDAAGRGNRLRPAMLR